ncbi:hypothetical protein GCM10023192_30030 [Amycolatopsis samaneae]
MLLAKCQATGPVRARPMLATVRPSRRARAAEIGLPGADAGTPALLASRDTPYRDAKWPPDTEMAACAAVMSVLSGGRNRDAPIL